MVGRIRHSSSAVSATLYVFAALTFAAGCGGSELEGRIAEGIRTVVEPATITAGGVAEVRCELVGGAGNVATTFVVEPAEAVTATDSTVTTTVAGTYRVSCRAPEFGLVDAEGALLEVVAAAPVKVAPVFGDNPIAAGQWTSVECAAVDEYGNAAPIAAEVQAEEPLLLSDGQITSEEAGAFDVTCATAEHPDLPREPATLTVVPGPAAQVELKVKPERLVFEPRAVARLYWEVSDTWGNPIPDAPGTLTAPGAGVTLMDADEHKYRLVDEGHYTFRVDLDAPNSGLSDDLQLTVDGAPPELVITWPARGETIEGDGSPVIVEGTITDVWSGVTFFEIDGDPVAVGADGAFEHPLEPEWGLNMFEVIAEDGGGHEVRLTPTYQYSQAFLPFAGSDAEGLKYDDGMVVLLGQAFLDDGDHDPSTIDDLATLFELLIGSLDLEELIAGSLAGLNQTIPLADYDWTIGIDNLSWVEVSLDGELEIALLAAETTSVGPTRVGIDSRDGGLDFDVALGEETQQAIDVDLQLSVTATFDLVVYSCSLLGCWPQPTTDSQLVGDATLTSGVSLDVFEIIMHADIAKQPDSPLEVSYSDFEVNLDTLDIDPIQDVVFSLGVVDLPLVGDQTFTFPLSDFIDLDALIGGLLDPLMAIFTDVVPALVNPLLESIAGPLIAGLFELIEIDTSFEIPPLLGERERRFFIDFYTGLSSVDFTDDGGTVGLSAGFYSDKGVEREPLGAIQRAGCLKNASDTLSWGWDPSVGFGLKTDMVNAALFATWWTGFLDGPLVIGDLGGSAPIPIDNVELTMQWLLPPIINDCGKGDGILQVGDLYVVLEGTALTTWVTVVLYADLALAAGFVTSEDGLSLRIGQLLFADFEVIEQDAGALGDAIDLEALVEDALPGLISSFLVGQEFGPFELPPVELSGIVPGVPPGTTLGLGNLSIEDQDGYIIVGGDLQ